MRSYGEPQTLLFERLPVRLFRPLAAPNNTRYWALICHLMEELWGAGRHAPGEEVLRRQVIQAIEAQLVANDPWEGEVETPLAIRATSIYDALVDTGWLAERRRGVRRMVTVRPTIARFHDLLVDFATAEPDDVGAKVQSIKINLEAAANGALSQYPEAASQARKCIARIATTGLRVQDLMDELVAAGSARAFVHGFFNEYVEKLFIADYRELHTRDHPLQYRSDIIAMTLDIGRDETRRSALIEWYRTKRAKGDAMRARALYERDTEQLLGLREIGRHLDRLDGEIRTANQRALAYFRYKTRTPSHFDKLIARALTGAESLPDGHAALPPARCVIHASPFGVPDGRRHKFFARTTKIVRRHPTIEQIALGNLRQRHIQDRRVSSADLMHYIARHLKGERKVHSDALEVTCVKDLCCYHHLLVIAARSECPPAFKGADYYLRLLPSLQVSRITGAKTRNRYFEHQAFVIYERGI